MLGYVKFFLPVISFGVFLSLIAVALERILIVKGYVRGNTIGLIIVILGFSIYTYTDFTYQNDLWFWITFLLISPVGINRFDFWRTTRQGRWWWKEESTQEKKE